MKPSCLTSRRFEWLVWLAGSTERGRKRVRTAEQSSHAPRTQWTVRPFRTVRRNGRTNQRSFRPSFPQGSARSSLKMSHWLIFRALRTHWRPEKTPHISRSMQFVTRCRKRLCKGKNESMRTVPTDSKKQIVKGVVFCYNGKKEVSFVYLLTKGWVLYPSYAARSAV